MSYILDALRKSDQERQRGTVPNLHSIQVPVGREPGRRIRWLHVLVLALLLNAGLLMWWLRPWLSVLPKSAAHHGSGEPATAEGVRLQPNLTNAGSAAYPQGSMTSDTAAPEVQVAQQETSRAAQPVAKSIITQPVDADRGKPKEPNRAETLAKPTPKTEPKVGTEAKADAGTPKHGPTTEQSRAEPSPKATASVPQTDAKQDPQKLQGADKQDRLISKLVPPPAAKEPEHAPGNPTKDNRVPMEPGQTDHKPTPVPEAPTEPAPQDARGLPTSVQRELPSLSFSMVIFSANPADRMININGRMMREGQEIGPGLKLEQITPDGAILNFQGHRFHKGVL